MAVIDRDVHLRCRAIVFDRRGVTALIFAAGAAAVLGIAGLATEAGVWYLAREQAANTADAIALAGAVAGAWGAGGGYNPASDSQLLTPLLGYSAAQLNPPPVAYNPPHSGAFQNTNATEALVSIAFQPVLASLFGGQPLTVSARAVALVEPTGNIACALSLTGPLTIAQSQNGISDSPCYYASNNAGPDAIVVTADFFAAQGTTTPGDCPTCPVVAALVGGAAGSGSASGLARPAASYQPPTTNPFAAIDTQLTLPTTSSGITCIVPSGQTPGCPASSTTVAIAAGASLVPTTGDNGVTCIPSGGPCAYYNMNITIGAGAALLPGTYLFVNSSLTIQGGTVVCKFPDPGNPQLSDVCDPNDGTSNQSGAPGAKGVTLVFSGSPAGNLTIASGATVMLSAPACATFPSADLATCGSPLNGVLFYRASPTVTDSGASPAVSIADGAGNSILNGGMYFPNAYVSFAANVGVPPHCSILVGGYLTLGPQGASNSVSQFLRDCAAYGTPQPAVQAAQVVE